MQYIHHLQQPSLKSDAADSLPTLTSLANEGLQLRSALLSWKIAANTWEESLQLRTRSPGLTMRSADTQMLLGQTFYSAISIFLSGVYDYHIHHWDEKSIACPILPNIAVKDHLETILELTAQALGTTQLAGLLFLFPLRVAGARARSATHREEIKRLLRMVEEPFVVAKTFSTDLEKIWSKRKSE